MRIGTLRKLKDVKTITPQLRDKLQKRVKQYEEKVGLMKKILKKKVEG